VSNYVLNNRGNFHLKFFRHFKRFAVFVVVSLILSHPVHIAACPRRNSTAVCYVYTLQTRLPSTGWRRMAPTNIRQEVTAATFCGTGILLGRKCFSSCCCLKGWWWQFCRNKTKWQQALEVCCGRRYYGRTVATDTNAEVSSRGVSADHVDFPLLSVPQEWRFVQCLRFLLHYL